MLYVIKHILETLSKRLCTIAELRNIHIFYNGNMKGIVLNEDQGPQDPEPQYLEPKTPGIPEP